MLLLLLKLGLEFWKRITTTFTEYQKWSESVFACLSTDKTLLHHSFIISVIPFIPHSRKKKIPWTKSSPVLIHLKWGPEWSEAVFLWRLWIASFWTVLGHSLHCLSTGWICLCFVKLDCLCRRVRQPTFMQTELLRPSWGAALQASWQRRAQGLDTLGIQTCYLPA